jgi:GDP/UDP-N,N'-diacetylbacillosamine 2-epimerase (hydrolysing)
MRKILIVLESRASYGYSRNIYKKFKLDKNILLKTLVTGTHLSKELGFTANTLKKDKIRINYKLKFNNKNFPNGIGKLIVGIDKILNKFKPEIVIIFGDRVELISVAIACCYRNNCLLAHVQAGDRSGHIDDMTRMALAKLCHIHFPATKKARNRLIKLGEQKKRIYLVGAPQLDDINYKKLKIQKYIKVNNKTINLKEKYFVILQHSVFKDHRKYLYLFKKTINACLRFKYKIYIIYPNYDPGYKAVITFLKKIKNKKIIIFKNIERQKFLSLVLHGLTLIGNSSSGILESPSLKVPVVNIGDRQRYRELNKNILNANYSANHIYKKIKLALNLNNKLKKIKNVHGDGKSSIRIYKIIKNLKINEFLLNKDTTY